jgi:hypothetical protein
VERIGFAEVECAEARFEVKLAFALFFDLASEFEVVDSKRSVLDFKFEFR